MTSAIAFIPPASGLTTLAPGATGVVNVGGGTFSSVFQMQLAQLDHSIKAAQSQSLRLAAGEAESLHQVMLSVEQARIAFQFALQVRNRVMDGWQDLQRMQL